MPRAFEKIQAAMEMEINTDEVGKGLGEYLRTHDTQYEKGILKDEADFKSWLTTYKTLHLTSEEKQWATEIQHLFEDSIKLSNNIVKLDKEMGTGRNSFVQMRREMDILMDDELQAHADNDLKVAEQETDKSVRTAISMIIFAGQWQGTNSLNSNAAYSNCSGTGGTFRDRNNPEILPVSPKKRYGSCQRNSVQTHGPIDELLTNFRPKGLFWNVQKG